MTNPFIVAVIGALAGIGLTNLLPKKVDGATTIFSGDQPIVTLPDQLLQATNEKALNNVKVTFRRITTPATKGDPQITLTNQSADMKLLHLSFIPDATFKPTGILEILVNNKNMLTSNSGDLTDTDALNIPIPNEGIELEIGGGVSVNAWGNTGSITVLILTGIK